MPTGATFAFGESPFLTKGVLYIGTKRFFDETVDGGTARLLDTIGERPERYFLEQKFLPNLTYDVMPAPALIYFEAKTVGLSVSAYLAQRTSWQADLDIHGVYRFLLSLTSPSLVATRLPMLLTQHFTFARPSLEKVAATERLAHFHHIPLLLEPWFHFSLAFYAKKILTLAGGQNVSITWEAPQEEPEEAGVPMCEMTMHLRWD